MVLGIQESNRSRNSHRSLELGFLTIGRCSRSHGEGVRTVGCLMAVHCWWLENRGCCAILRICVVMLDWGVDSYDSQSSEFRPDRHRLVGSITSPSMVNCELKVGQDLESVSKWQVQECGEKYPKRYQQKRKKPGILAICHLKADGQKSWRSWKKHESKWCWPALSHAVAWYSSNHSTPWRSDTFQIAWTWEPLSFSCPASLFRPHVWKVYVPEMVFGHLLTSDNYDDTACKAWSSRSCFKGICWNTNILPEKMEYITLLHQS